MLYVRTVRNPFGVPYFFAIIHDPDACAPHLLNGGFGCHPHRSVAFVRAVAEAAQSRLSFIHGGRDDLDTMLARYRGWSARRKRGFVESVVRRASQGEAVPMQAVDDHGSTVRSVEACEELVLRRFRELGFAKAYRVAFSAPEDDLQIARVIVPRMELFSEAVTRFGVRLRDHARAGVRS